MVGLQTLDLAIGVRVPASQPKIFRARSMICHLKQYFAPCSLLLPLASGNLSLPVSRMVVHSILTHTPSVDYLLSQKKRRARQSPLFTMRLRTRVQATFKSG